MLEETRLQMQMMQENFVRIEAGLNAEIEQLNVQLQNNVSKLVYDDEHYCYSLKIFFINFLFVFVCLLISSG